MTSTEIYKGKVLVAGATGKTGRWVVRRLLHYGIPVRVMVRDPEKARDLGDEVEVVKGRVQDAAEVAAAMQGCNAVISALGSSAVTGESSPAEVDRDGVIRLVDEAVRAGVKHFGLVSSLAVTKWYHPLNLFGGLLTMKFAAEEHLRKHFATEGRTYTIVRPGGLRDGEPLAHALVIGEGDHLWSGWTNRSDVAELLVASLWNPDAANHTFEVVSGEPAVQESLEPYFRGLTHA